MTEQVIRIPGLGEDDTITVNYLLEKLREVRPHNKKRSDLYDGKRAVQQVGSVIPPQYYRLGLALGWAAKGVDGLARRCRLDRMQWIDGDLDQVGMRELEDSNFLYSELAQARTDSLMHGVSFLVTTQGEDGEPKALVHAKDALNATGEWNNRAKRLDSLLSITSWDRNRVTGFYLYQDGVTVEAEVDEYGRWVMDRSEHAYGMPAEALVYKPRLSKKLGRSRITPAAISHQHAAVRELIRLEGHMDVYSMPQLWLLGASEAIFKNADGSQKAAWQIALGRMFGIPDDEEAPAGSSGRAEVKQVDASSPAPHLADLNALAKLEAREYDLPDSDFALTDLANPTSSDSYTASRENLIAEAEGAMDDWSVPTRRTVARALAIQNGDAPEAFASVKPDWRSPVYVSRAAEADAGGKQLAAVEWLKDTEVGLQLLGLTPDQIDRALKERTANNGRRLAQAVIERRTAPANDAA